MKPNQELFKRMFALVLFTLLGPSVLVAQESADKAALPQPTEQTTLQEYQRQLQSFFEGTATPAAATTTTAPTATTTATDPENALTAIAEAKELEADTEIPAKVAQKPTTANPAQGFDTRVGSAIADFLPFLQFAISGVDTSEDKRSVTVNFNPLDVGWHGAISLSATATEPILFSPLESKIVASQQENQRKLLLGKAGDFGDVTAALTYGYQLRAGSWDTTTRKLFGRNYRLYENLIEEVVKGSLKRANAGRVETQEKLRPFRLKIGRGGRELSKLTFGEIRQVLGDDEHQQFINLLAEEASAIGKITTELQSLTEALPALIDNQPQLTFQASYRESQDAIGPDAAGITLRYEMGSRNFNRVLREYHWLKRNDPDAATPTQALQRVIGPLQGAASAAEGKYQNEDKLTFSVSYNEADEYSFEHAYEETLTDPATQQEVKIPRVASLELPHTTEWRASVQWSRLLVRSLGNPKLRNPSLLAPFAGQGKLQEALGEQRLEPRLVISAEVVDVENDPTRQDQVIGRASLEIPLQGGLTFPLTIKYANRSEFLQDQDKVFSGHIGVSYKIPGLDRLRAAAASNPANQAAE